MYSKVFENIKTNNAFPVCVNQRRLNEKKYEQLYAQAIEREKVYNKIVEDFGEEYASDAEREWKGICRDRDTIYTCLKLNETMDALMQEIIDEYSLEFIGNGSKGCDGTKDLSHLWNHDNASCFKTKNKDHASYIFLEHAEVIYNGHYFMDFDIHYLFSNECECKLLEFELRSHDDYFDYSDEPNHIGFVDLHYDAYEKAEYFYMQSRLLGKIRQFFDQHQTDIILWEEPKR